MASEVLSLLAWANVTAGAGIVFVLALRVPVRRLAGARVAYALWLLPLFAFLAWLAPARQMELVLLPTPDATAVASISTASASDTPALLIITAWFIGIAGTMTIFALRQRLYVRSAGSIEPVSALGDSVFSAAPSHGPAVVGALRPIILLPRDFDTRFSAEERALVLAHERTHLDRFDPLVNAAAMGLRAVNWFNPLVHVASHALRIDQELACDASVLARHANSRRAYAEAMLKSHTAAFQVPVGCAWHTPAFHSLKERILMLKSSPSQLGRGLGLSLIVFAAFAVSGAVWLMRPVEVLAAPTPEAADSGVGRDDVMDAQDALEVPDVDEVPEVEEIPEVVEVADDVDAMSDVDVELREVDEDVRQETRRALKDARAAIARAREDAARESAAAMKAARAVIADAHLAMLELEPAIAAAKDAVRQARPAIAAAQQAIKSVQPVIAAARREAASAIAAQRAEIDVQVARARASAMARLSSACKRALARTPSPSRLSEEELRVLKKLVCIPGRFGQPTSTPQQQD